MAIFALPASMPVTKCEQYRAEVEAALARQFGRPVPIRLRTDKEPERKPVASDYPSFEDEVYDPSELVDAPPGDAPATGVDRLVEAFPGAELMEERD